MCAGVSSAARRKLVGMLCKFSATEMRCLAATRCLPKFRNPRFPFASNALKIWEVWNIPHAEFSPVEKTLYRIPPPLGIGMVCPKGTPGDIQFAPTRSKRALFGMFCTFPLNMQKHCPLMRKFFCPLFFNMKKPKKPF